MGGRYRAYPEYKYSGVEWVGGIPAHWSTKKLKYLANVLPSNIDKKTRTEEISVSLCNYTDVYYNDLIGVSINFMKATATEEQIAKFTLRAGDTIITKDSEDPNDIAVPTFVPEDLDGVVCGYHLAMIRPFVKTFGAMIKRNFESGYARAYFATRSNGLTRYGLGSHSLGSAIFLKPPLNEAETIANFLDHETAQIDTLIDKQQQLITLLKEKRQAVISHAVTKGLNPDAPMKSSGVEWLGIVPEHWTTSKIGYCAVVSNGATPSRENPAYWENGSVGWLNSSKVNDVFIYDAEQFITDLALEQTSVRVINKNDLVMAITGEGQTRGRVAVSNITGTINQHLASISISVTSLNHTYLFYWLTSQYDRIRFESSGAGSTKGAITCSDIVNYPTPIPPLKEQRKIVDYLDSCSQYFDALNKKSAEAVSLLQERRTALISAAVTGKIDVRNWQPPTEPQADKETP